MSARPRFEEVLDRCIDDIAAGRRTTEQCLEAWPEHREALAAVLDAASALHELPRVPERGPDPASRAQFMSQIRTLPQEPLLEPVPGEAGAPRRQWRRVFRMPRLPALGSGWPALRSFGRAGAIAVPAAAAAVLAIVLVLGGGASRAHAATLTVFDGAVEIAGDDGWSKLEDGEEISEGDRLRTGADGRALVTFADGSTVALDPETEFTVAELALDGARRITLVQASGRLWHNVAPDPAGGGYTIETPDAIVTATGTLFETLVRAGETAVTTEEGSVEVIAGQLRASVRAGETTVAQARRVLAEVQRRQGSSDQQLQLSVDAPFTASLIDEHERATGALPDGLVFQQVPNATTTDPGQGAQQIAIHSPQDGTYELVLRRFENGEGVVVIRIGDQVHRIPVDAIQNAVRIRLKLASRDGRLEVTPEVIDRVTQDTIEDVVEHLVVTDRARGNAQSVADQRATLLAAQPPARPTAESTAEPTRPAGSDGSNDRPAATATPTATPGDAATASPTATATASTGPDGGSDATPTGTPTSTATPELDATAVTASPAGDLALDQAAERCANGIRFDNISIDECLKRWPQFGDSLVELVRERLQALQRPDVTLEEAFRICLFQIASGDHAPQDCYDRWPHYAGQLADLLQIAIGSEPVPTPTVAPSEGADALGDTDSESLEPSTPR